ncbi:MAG: hypothetical protein R2752_16040 [Vicinamibacterales bacterium]
MRIFPYWARATDTVGLPDGRRASLTAFGWSAESIEDARRVARDRLAAQADRLRRGDPFPDAYAYGSRPLREDVEDDDPTGDGQGRVVVTRNAHGSLVLNAPRTMFLDVDLPPPSAGGLLRGLFGRRSDPEAERLAALRAALGATGRTCRIYRTAAGFRALAVDRECAPEADETQALMAAAGVDPAYARLCRVQQSFRARLTPKAWRVGVKTKPPAFPRETAEQDVELTRWIQAYDQACAGHATCRYLETVGTGATCSEVAPVLALHDERTRSLEALPLA